ncbi:hypothetical protein G6F59_015789 [Rhizopus arrhizus]|nr:hypothetical protein G6F59_015789 [Rhizopus arrhizus]
MNRHALPLRRARRDVRRDHRAQQQEGAEPERGAVALVVQQQAAHGGTNGDGHLHHGHHQAAAGLSVIGQGAGQPRPPGHGRRRAKQAPQREQHRHPRQRVADEDHARSHQGHQRWQQHQRAEHCLVHEGLDQHRAGQARSAHQQQQQRQR